MKDPFYSKGLRFECQRCSRCCRQEPGFVYLSENDCRALSLSLGITQEDFIRSYCRTVQGAAGLLISLLEKDNYDCIFWESGGCAVYEHRPFQCRSYPFWENYLASGEAWNSLEADCPGVNRGSLHTYEEIENWRQMRRKENYTKMVDMIRTVR